MKKKLGFLFKVVVGPNATPFYHSFYVGQFVKLVSLTPEKNTFLFVDLEGINHQLLKKDMVEEVGSKNSIGVSLYA